MVGGENIGPDKPEFMMLVAVIVVRVVAVRRVGVRGGCGGF
jgi:hypothetical protein